MISSKDGANFRRLSDDYFEHHPADGRRRDCVVVERI
jgi:hypothetical protein